MIFLNLIFAIQLFNNLTVTYTDLQTFYKVKLQVSPE